MKFKPKFKKFGKLPGKPSKLIRLALADLELAENSKEYRIEMRTWHKPHIYSFMTAAPRTTRCYVCLAGSVMAGTLGGNVRNWLSPNSYPKECRALLALDYFRTGRIQSGFELLGLNNYDVNNINIIGDFYRRRPKAFKKYLNTLADSLESQGF